MFRQKWSTSERKYDVVVARDVKLPMPDGTLLDGNIYRPASDEKFPVILGAHGYNKDLQSPPMRPVVLRRCAATWKAAIRRFSRGVVTFTRYSTPVARGQ